MQNIHFLGIAGSGASAAAAIAQAQGYTVTGCDTHPHNEFTTSFSSDQLSEGHNPSHLTCNPGGCSVDLLVVTPAIFSLDPNNPELIKAKEKNIPIITWQQFLGEYLAKNKFMIAISGTHGKSTTTAMISLLLEEAGLDPTVVIGAIVPQWETNYRIGNSQYLVVEADEFNDNFLWYTPTISVVTTIEMDHPEYFNDFEAVKKSFSTFLSFTKQTIIANLKDPGVKQVLAANLRGCRQIIDYSEKPIEFPLRVPGNFNIYNASAAYQIGIQLGIATDIIQHSLENYNGISRRFEYIGSYQQAQIYSDFAHHPTEIKVTIEAARKKFPAQRILLIYQPHMFSRTKVLFDDFVTVFQKLPIDKMFLLDIYPSREVDTGMVNSQQLIDAIHKDSIVYTGSAKKALAQIKPDIRPNDVIFFMGAGDSDQLARELVSTQN